VAEECQVWPEHWHAVQVFLGLQAQWRCAAVALGGLLWLGLDYTLFERIERSVRAIVPRELRLVRRRAGQLVDLVLALQVAATKVLNRA